MRTALAALIVAFGPAVGVADELTGIAGIAAGSHHTCALTTAGGMKCWGINSAGQLGLPAGAPQLLPIDVPGATSGVRAMAAGGDNTCALMDSGAVQCWGGLPGYVPDPGVVVSAISVGDAHACLLTSGGGVKCWGEGSVQLGAGTGTGSATPVDVVGLASGIVAISAGAGHTCALTALGGVKCWGTNTRVFLTTFTDGRLGDGTEVDRPTPVDVVDLAGEVVSIHAFAWNTCAVTAAGGAKCWGSGFGPRPVDVTGWTSGVASLAGGGALQPRFSVSIPPSTYTHLCALSPAGSVGCKGDNSFGQQGNGSLAAFPSTPLGVTGLDSGVAAVAAGAAHVCALTVAGRVRCWGSNASGQLGEGTTSTIGPNTARDVVGMTSGVASISAGSLHTCARTTDGAARCWGANAFSRPFSNATGALGDGTFTDRPAAVAVQGLESGVAAVTAGGMHSCAAMASGGARCWGDSGFGQVGDGVIGGQVFPRPNAVLVSGLAGAVTQIAAGNLHTCAVAGGSMYCWGSNTFGQIGDGSSGFPSNRYVPVNVPGFPSGVTHIATGGNHTCAIGVRGGTSCWGDNYAGQLGDGTTTNRSTAVPIPALAGALVLSAGYSHTCALMSGGRVQCWGANDRGQVGDGTTSDRATPTDVVGLSSGVIALDAGVSHTCALTSAGGVKCWGANDSGQLGDGSLADRWVPVSVLGAASSVAAISAGLRHTCALTTAGGVKCWGLDTSGQLGRGIVSVSGLRAVPAPVLTFLAPVNPPRLANISTRMQVMTGDNVLIGGFIIGGFSPKTVVVRARGPSLTPMGVPNVLADPTLSLYSGQAVIASNDNFGTSANLAQLQASGFAPSEANEAAILITLGPGPYTAIVSGAGGTTGIGMVEVFEVGAPEVPVVNIATRGQVLTGDSVMIGGFVIYGDGPQTVVVRARGPSLAALGVPGVLANPVLSVFSGQTVIASNDNFGSAANLAQLMATGLQPLDPLEAAVLLTLNPGAYTAIVSGVGGSTGVAIVEVLAVVP